MRSLALVSTLLDVLGAAAVIIGVALICVPAAWIVAGVAILAISWHLNRPVIVPTPPDATS